MAKRPLGDPMLDYESLLAPQSSKKIYTTITGKIYDLYLSGEIESPEEYSDWFQVIRTAAPDDVIRIHINSPGGDLLTTVQFLAAMKESQAHLFCLVEGYCMSAATMIFLAGQYYVIADYSVFMFHNYSGGTFGKGGEMFDSISHERSWSSSMMSDVYKHFLTPEEIEAMLDNKDLWMSKEQVIKRLEVRNALLDEERESAEGESEKDESTDIKETAELTGEVEIKPKTRRARKPKTKKEEKEDAPAGE